jgi:hypothetical protein
VIHGLCYLQGEATDLYLNKKFLNDMLPPRFSVSKASCKKIKWQVCLQALRMGGIVKSQACMNDVYMN